MKKFYVIYADKSGDTTRVWTMANNEQDARNQITREYWDIDRIVSIYPA